jgi:beta-phosphoglucomutase-like phosphatase (HAD superfamily)
MDGVVVDNVPIHFRARKKMAEDYARAFTFEDYKAKVDGIPRIDGARAILEGMDEETVLAASEKKQHYFLDLLGKEEIPTDPSTLDLITELRRLQVRVAAISSSKNAPLILERMGLVQNIRTASSSRMRFWGSRRQSGPECSVWASIAITLPTVWRRQILSSVTWPR